MLNRELLVCAILSLLLLLESVVPAAEVVTLSEKNWQAYAPGGKEADCIYGDYVMRNDKIVAVIADPVSTRNANMTVRNVAAMLIDLTLRDAPNDQLSAFYPGGLQVSFSPPAEFGGGARSEQGGEATAGNGTVVQGEEVSIYFRSQKADGLPQVTVTYKLDDDAAYIAVITDYENPGEKPITFELRDAMRADRTFAFGQDPKTNLFWAYDEWFRQAYGIVVTDHEMKRASERGVLLQYLTDGSAQITLNPGANHQIARQVFPAADLLAARAIANQLAGQRQLPVALSISDKAGGVDNARVTLSLDGKPYGSARTSPDGKISCVLPAGIYDAVVDALGRPSKRLKIDTTNSALQNVQLEPCGYVQAAITDQQGGPLPCKVEFIGSDGTTSPDFGPDSRAVSTGNLYYSHDGSFRQEIGPGKYQVIISHGPEFDAVFTTIDVAAGKDTKLAAKLIRVVDTSGWISSDFHSHSSPSGDNTASQFGRVLNLLAEHIEFAPCTEHNRIDSYLPHLRRLAAEHLMATCTGMELTGNPLPVNHQNAFPLHHKPHTQDGGAPTTHSNPIVQIERLAMWDNGSEKLVQGNHPNLAQILGDRNTDGVADGGFRDMIGFMDVIEVHPPEAILVKPGTPEFKSLRRNPIFQWLQMLNVGYRKTGVVNTDAHYNFHGSGWLRNYIKSPTDSPQEIKTMDMVRACERGQVVMTNGPFLEVSAESEERSATPGEDLAAPNGNVTLRVRVQCPNWLDIDRVQILLNGKLDDTLNFTRRQDTNSFGNSVVKFEAEIPIELQQDTHIVVVAAGEGLKLGPVYGSQRGKMMPVAVSNPVFVDVDGGGFKANGDNLGAPLPIEDGFRAKQ